jgi:hypothetical protein
MKCKICGTEMTGNVGGGTDAVIFNPTNTHSNRKICLQCFYDLVSQNQDIIKKFFEVRHKVEIVPIEEKMRELCLPADKDR